MLLFVFKGFAQDCLVYGTTAPDMLYKYAYLYDLDSKTFLTAPIVNHQFSFKLNKPDKLSLFTFNVNTNLMKSHEELIKSPDYRMPNKGRLIALEDSVSISMTTTTQEAAVKGGTLNKAIDDMFLAIKSRKYESFFEQYSDSPVAIVFLKSLAELVAKGVPTLSKTECKTYYNKLSDRLKNSAEGQEILKIIGI